MILIADSGTTKTDWAVVSEDGKEVVAAYTTPGLNPTYFTDEALMHRLAEGEIKDLHGRKFSDIFFFGAGCGVQKYASRMRRVLTQVFPKADGIYVDGDIQGAVFACTEQPGVVGILGTGSNICYYDGNSINLRIPSLGYTLMDDGSGNMIGKKLLRAYYFQQMPIHLREAFANLYDLDIDLVKARLYGKDATPGTYLASHAPFLFRNMDDRFMQGLLVEVIEGFYLHLVDVYEEELRRVPLHFVGSVAYQARDQLLRSCKNRGFTLGNIVRHPIDNLTRRIPFLRSVYR